MDNSMKICFVSESLKNPHWSACNFFLEGLQQVSDTIGIKHSDHIPDGYEWYIDVDSARQKDPIRVDGKVCALIFDLFDEDCDQSWRYAMAESADLVLVTNDCSRRKIREAGIDTECHLITFGVKEDIWKPNKIDTAYDSMFIGNITRKSAKKRGDYLQALRDVGFNVDHNHMHFFLHANARILNLCRIGIEIPNDGYDTFGIRVMEIIGCGLPLLTQADGIVERIIPNHFATFYDGSIINFVEKYVEIDENYEEKLEFGEGLRNFFLDKFTYKHVAQRIIKALNGEYDEAEMFCS